MIHGFSPLPFVIIRLQLLDICLPCYLGNSMCSGLKISPPPLCLYINLYPISFSLFSFFVLLSWFSDSLPMQLTLASKVSTPYPDPCPKLSQFWIFRHIQSTPRLRPKSQHSLFLPIPQGFYQGSNIERAFRFVMIDRTGAGKKE